MVYNYLVLKIINLNFMIYPMEILRRGNVNVVYFGEKTYYRIEYSEEINYPSWYEYKSGVLKVLEEENVMSLLEQIFLRDFDKFVGGTELYSPKPKNEIEEVPVKYDTSQTDH